MHCDTRLLLDSLPLIDERRVRYFVRQALVAYEDDPVVWSWLDDLDHRLDTPVDVVLLGELRLVGRLRVNGQWVDATIARRDLAVLREPELVCA